MRKEDMWTDPFPQHHIIGDEIGAHGGEFQARMTAIGDVDERVDRGGETGPVVVGTIRHLSKGTQGIQHG